MLLSPSLLRVMSSIFFSSKLPKLILLLAWNPLAKAAEADEMTRFFFRTLEPSRRLPDPIASGGVERQLVWLLSPALVGVDPVSVMELAGETTGKDCKLQGGRIDPSGTLPLEEAVEIEGVLSTVRKMSL